GLRVTIERREVEHEVIVLRGRYEPRPLLAGDEGKVLHVFAEPVPPQGGFGGNESSNLRTLLDRLGDRVSRRFLDESQTPADLKIAWHDHLVLASPELGRNSEQGRVMLDRLLANLSKQTSLEFRRETRRDSMWSLTRDR